VTISIVVGIVLLVLNVLGLFVMKGTLRIERLPIIVGAIIVFLGVVLVGIVAARRSS
jgi:hypothetical protein